MDLSGDVREAEFSDLAVIETFFTDARLFLACQGLPQWQNGYGPNRDMAAQDIHKREGYVLVVDHEPCGYAALAAGVDESYTHLRDGRWMTPGESDLPAPSYLSIHRFALAANRRGRGHAAALMNGLLRTAAKRGCWDIRIDTHPRNRIMEKVILRAGFSYRGMVDLPIPDGERKAYQWYRRA